MFLTGRDNEVDKILGTEIGADDYITKPFNPRELTIRARNLLSRTMNPAAGEERRGRELQVQRLGAGHQQPLADQPGRRTVQAAAQRIPRHAALLRKPGKIQSRGELLKKMTGRELKPHDRTVDVTIRRIRKHFESTPDTPEIIATIHGEGYRFCGDLEEPAVRKRGSAC